MAVTPLELAKVAAAAADEKKATDIVLLDLSKMSDVCDYFLICTVGSNPQMDAVTDAIREKVGKNCGMKPLSTEGRASSTWTLMDYGPLVVHVFRPEARDYYRLERLWGEAPRVELDLDGAMADDAYADMRAALDEGDVVTVDAETGEVSRES